LSENCQNGYYALIGTRWGETLSRHVIDFDQWEHANIYRCTIMGLKGLGIDGTNLRPADKRIPRSHSTTFSIVEFIMLDVWKPCRVMLDGVERNLIDITCWIQQCWTLLNRTVVHVRPGPKRENNGFKTLHSFRTVTLGNLSKHDGDGWRERHKTKGLISKTMTLHLRYIFLYISLPSSAKQQREMTKFKVLWRTWTHDSEFSFLYLNCNAVLTESAPGLFGYIRQIERVETTAKKFEIFGSHFGSDVFVGVAVVVA